MLQAFPAEGLGRVTTIVTRNHGEELLRLNFYLKSLVHGGHFLQALHYFKGLHSSNDPKPDNYTLSIAVTACANLHDTKLGTQLHAYSVQSRLGAFLGVGNSLLSMYAKSWDLASVKKVFGEIKSPDIYSYTTLLSAGTKLGDIDYACSMFNKFPQWNVAVWNAMITGSGSVGYDHIAFEFFKQMQAKGVKPDHYTFASILSYCSSEKVDFGKQVHCLVVKTGFFCRVSVINSLLTMYFECTSAAEGYSVFEDAELEVRDQITYNAIISGLVSMERYDEAVMRLKDMLSVGLSPTESTIVSVMGACFFPQIAQQVHGLAIKSVLAECIIVSNAAISMYSNVGDLGAACRVFERLKERDAISWNAIITSYAKENLVQDAIFSYNEMQSHGIAPDEFSIGSLLACSESLEVVEMIQAIVVKNALILKLEVLNAFISAFSRNGEIELASEFFHYMPSRNLISWNGMISGFLMNGLPEYGLQYFSNMLLLGFQLNEYTLSLVTSICSSISDLKLGKEVHGYVLKAGYFSHTLLANTFIALYSKCGALHLSLRVFDTMKDKDSVSWNSIISSLAQYGEGREAIQRFESMRNSGQYLLDKATFTAVLSACNRSGFIVDGIRIFNLMINDHHFKPEAVHFSCMVDLLGRTGFLGTAADDLIKNRSNEIDYKVWWTLLSLCSTYGHLQLGSVVAEILLEMKKDDPSVHVLLSNLYANAGKWEESASLRESMKSYGVVKQPGNSWITS